MSTIATLHALPLVFVVDDDDSTRVSIARLIQASGGRAVTFSSAREFLAHPRATQPRSACKTRRRSRIPAGRGCRRSRCGQRFQDHRPHHNDV